jgi:hypothetical protein
MIVADWQTPKQRAAGLAGLTEPVSASTTAADDATSTPHEI